MFNSPPAVQPGKKSKEIPPKKARLATKAYSRSVPPLEPDWSLVESYLPLVKSIVGKMRMYFPPQVDVEDIYSVGVSGLISATQRLDPAKAKSFGSFATLRVRGAILDELRRLDWMPRASRIKAKQYRKVVDQLEQTLRRPATEEEIRKELGISLKEYRILLDRLRPISMIPLDRSVNPDGNDQATVHDIIADDTELNARESCENREVIQLLRERIEQLPEAPRKVLILYYFEGLRLAEIATVFNLTESRICQIHAQAVIGLRTYLARALVK